MISYNAETLFLGFSINLELFQKTLLSQHLFMKEIKKKLVNNEFI